MPGGKGKQQKTADQKAEPTLHFSGVVRKLDDKSLELEATDTRTITFQLSEKTVKPAELKVGVAADIEATQDKEGLFHAVGIKLSAPAATTAAADTAEANDQETRPSTVVRSGPVPDEGDAGPPKLKRGKPSEYARNNKRAEETAPPESAAETATAAADPRHEFIEKARAMSISFVKTLPNYVCQQFTTRYVSENHVTDWKARDVVSAEVVYEDGKESYRNLAINGKATKKSVEETGAWSTGEFGTLLSDLFSEGTAAEFHYARDAKMAGLTASIYDYEVERPHSHWKVMVPGQFIRPAYRGSVWVDKKSARVLRIEIQAKEIPDDFPRDMVETALDYEFVSLGTEKYLLPVKAEILSCLRGTNSCERNTIEFRNYHRFSGASTIKFNQ